MRALTTKIAAACPCVIGVMRMRRNSLSGKIHDANQITAPTTPATLMNVTIFSWVVRVVISSPGVSHPKNGAAQDYSHAAPFWPPKPKPYSCGSHCKTIIGGVKRLFPEGACFTHLGQSIIDMIYDLLCCFLRVLLFSFVFEILQSIF